MDAPRSQKLHSQRPTPSDIRAIRQVSERSCRRLGNTHAAGISDFDFDFDFDWRLETGDWRLETGDWRLETGDWRLETTLSHIPRMPERITPRLRIHAQTVGPLFHLDPREQLAVRRVERVR